jgi:hypothetical protein
MSSPAARLRALCDEGLAALEENRLEDLDQVMAGLAAVGRPEDAGRAEEIEAALEATLRLHDAVAREAENVEREIEHVRRGKRALGRYGAPAPKMPRAVDRSA